MKANRVTRQEALQLYLDLGPKRTLDALRKKIDETPGMENVSGRTLGGWCARYAWTRRAKEHDLGMRGLAASEHVMEAARAVTLARGDMCDTVAMACIEILLPKIAGLEPDKVAELALTFMRAGHLFSGGATEHTKTTTAEERPSDGDSVLKEMMGKIDTELSAERKRGNGAAKRPA